MITTRMEPLSMTFEDVLKYEKQLPFFSILNYPYAKVKFPLFSFYHIGHPAQIYHTIRQSKDDLYKEPF